MPCQPPCQLPCQLPRRRLRLAGGLVAWGLVVAATIVTTLVATGIPEVVHGTGTAGAGHRLLVSPPAPSGFRLVRDDEAGFAVVIPASYFKFELTKNNLDAIERQIKEHPDTEAAAVLKNARDLVAHGAVLLFYDESNGGGVILRRLRQAGPLPSDFQQTTLTELESAGADVLSTGRNTIAGRNSARVTYSVTDETGEPLFRTEVVVEGDNGTAWALTVESTRKDDPRRDPVIDSLRVT